MDNLVFFEKISAKTCRDDGYLLQKWQKGGGCCFLRLTKSQKACIVLAKQDGVAVKARDYVIS
jgi:hypothetical protein